MVSYAIMTQINNICTPELGRAIEMVIKEGANQKKQVEDLKKENAELRKELIAVRGRGEPPAAPAGETPFPDRFTARIMGCSSTEKATMNTTFYNPGFPFSGDVFIYNENIPENLGGSAVMRVRYAPATPVGYIEVPMLHRLYFALPMDEEVKFIRAGAVPISTNCTVYVSNVGSNVTRIPTDLEAWKTCLEGSVCVTGCAFAIQHADRAYKITPRIVKPSTTAIIGKDTKLTVLTEHDYLN
jgi:hypothetical protein